jgi:hypothetical protein
MFKKEQIDKFILREAFSFLKEEKSDIDIVSIDDSIDKVKNSLKVAKENFKNLTSELKRSENSVTGIQGSSTIANLQKKKANLDVLINKEKLNQSKNNQDAIESQLKSLEQQKTQIKDFENEKETSISEAVQIAPIKQVKQVVPSKKIIQTPNTTPVKNKPPYQKKEVIVKFDKNTTNPFVVKFTDRGFIVGGTRLSFELLDKAISKEFSITLKSGLVLTPVKMQKIIKYKERV